MDLNELLYHHQVALIHAAEAPASCAQSPFDLVRHYQFKLTRHRLERGLAIYPPWRAVAQLGGS